MQKIASGYLLDFCIIFWNIFLILDDKLAPPKLSEQELEDMIDQILKDDDFNNDGYIDYSEFLKAQQART